MNLDLERLSIIHYPDPRLRQICEPVTEFNHNLEGLVRRMYEIMLAGKGVGLAAPQVGVNLRFFVMNVTGKEEDNLVLINPELREMHGSREAEEGCLSLPEVYAQVRRAAECVIRAQDINGKTFELHGTDLACRVWQHETDHLNGTLLVDRMGPGDKIKSKKKLKELELTFKENQR